GGDGKVGACHPDGTIRRRPGVIAEQLRWKGAYPARAMSLDLTTTDSPVLTSIDQCVDWIREGDKPREAYLLGLEHEKFIYPTGGSNPVPYEGRQGVEGLFEALMERGYAPFREAPDRPVIALTWGRATVSLEPGGQFELSGSPHRTAREAHAENLAHL